MKVKVLVLKLSESNLYGYFPMKHIQAFGDNPEAVDGSWVQVGGKKYFAVEKSETIIHAITQK